MAYFTSFVECEDAQLPTWEEQIEPNKSPQESMSNTSFKATRIFMVAWSDRVEFINRVMGYARGKTLYMPHRYPYVKSAICTSVGVEGIGVGSKDAYGVAGYEKAKLSVSYETMPYETRTDQVREPFVTENLEGAAEYITVPANNLYWTATKNDDGNIILSEPLEDAEAPGLLQKLWTWTYTMHMLPEVPTEVCSLIGKTNKKTIRSKALGYTFLPGTLLFGVPSLRPVTSVAGVLSWEVTLNITYNPRGWNVLHRQGGKAPVPLYAYSSVGTPPKDVATVYNIYEPETFKSVLTEV